MDPIDIKHAIEKAGCTQAEIARRRGVTRSMVNLVIWQGAKSKHIQQEIADVIDLPIETIWPEYQKAS